jgi:hypothetical protein
MATNNNRLKRTTVTGVVNTGNGNSRLDTTQAERKAAEALAKAKEAIELINNIQIEDNSELKASLKELQQSVQNITEKLNNLPTNAITIEQIELPEDALKDLWEGKL